MGAARPKGLRVRIECATLEEFVEAFHRDTDASSVFVPTAKVLPEGAECAFSLELPDGQPMLRGLGVVLNSWSTAANRFGRAGVHIGFTQLTTSSEAVLEELLEAREAAPELGRKRSNTQQLWGGVVSPTMEIEAENGVLEDEVIGDVRRTRERVALDAAADPAAPIAELRTTETTRYEGPLRAPAIPAPPLWEPPRVHVQATGDDEGVVAPAPWWRNARVAAVFASGLLFGCLISLALRSPQAASPQVAARAAAPVATTVQVAAREDSAACAPASAAAAPPVIAMVEPATAKPGPGPRKKKIVRPAIATKPAATKQVATKRIATKQVATKRIAPKPVAPKQGATKQVATKQVASNQQVARVTRKPSAAVALFPPGSKRARKGRCASLSCL